MEFLILNFRLLDSLIRKSKYQNIQFKNIKNVQLQDIKMKKGFTLVELLLYMSLLGILLVIMTDVLVSVLNVQNESKASSSVEQDGRYILARLAYDVPQATAIVSPAAPGQVATNSAILTINGTNYTYDGSTGNLLLTNTNGTDQLNSFGTQISNLTFQELGQAGGKNDLQIKFTLTSRILKESGPQTQNFQITLGQR